MIVIIIVIIITILLFQIFQVVVGCLVDDAEDLELFLNSISSAGRAGINKNKFCVFTTNKQVYNDMKNTGIKARTEL